MTSRGKENGGLTVSRGSERSRAEYKEEWWKKNEYFKFPGILRCIDWLSTFRGGVVPSSSLFYLPRWKNYAFPKRRLSLYTAYRTKKTWTVISTDDRTSNFARYETESLEYQVRLHLFRITEVNWSGQLHVIRGVNHTEDCTCRKNVQVKVVQWNISMAWIATTCDNLPDIYAEEDNKLFPTFRGEVLPLSSWWQLRWNRQNKLVILHGIRKEGWHLSGNRHEIPRN